MTIDERLEALTMHLEVLTHMHEDFEKRMTAYTAEVTRSTTDLAKSNSELKDVMTRLANIVIAHDETLEDHETRLKELGGRSL
jgi:hypothetical protein